MLDATISSLSRLGSCHSGGFYYGVAVHPIKGEIWACALSAGALARLSPTGTCLQTVPLPDGALPYGIAIHPEGRYIYVTDVSSYIYIYDIQTNQWAIAEISDAIGLYGLRWVGTRDLGCSLYVLDGALGSSLLPPPRPSPQAGRERTRGQPQRLPRSRGRLGGGRE